MGNLAIKILVLLVCQTHISYSPFRNPIVWVWFWADKEETPFWQRWASWYSPHSWVWWWSLVSRSLFEGLVSWDLPWIPNVHLSVPTLIWVCISDVIQYWKEECNPFSPTTKEILSRQRVGKDRNIFLMAGFKTHRVLIISSLARLRLMLCHCGTGFGPILRALVLPCMLYSMFQCLTNIWSY